MMTRRLKPETFFCFYARDRNDRWLIMLFFWQRPEDTFSEFTYGFALVNELVGPAYPPILSVPVFPSLVAEGRAGGGYDVALNRPGRPLFLQFKLARRIRGWRAREFQQGFFKQAFYRMYVRPRHASEQHALLTALEAENRGTVFYCAPAFHTLGQLDAFYRAGRIAWYSRFVRPSRLPVIDDDEDHWLSFQRARGGTTAFFSPQGRPWDVDERPIEVQLQEALRKVDRVPLKLTLERLAAWFDERVTARELLLQAELDDDPERREDIRKLAGARWDVTPIEKIVMLSQTVQNCAFCIVQERVSQ